MCCSSDLSWGHHDATQASVFPVPPVPPVLPVWPLLLLLFSRHCKRSRAKPVIRLLPFCARLSAPERCCYSSCGHVFKTAELFFDIFPSYLTTKSSVYSANHSFLCSFVIRKWGEYFFVDVCCFHFVCAHFFLLLLLFSTWRWTCKGTIIPIKGVEKCQGVHFAPVFQLLLSVCLTTYVKWA